MGTRKYIVVDVNRSRVWAYAIRFAARAPTDGLRVIGRSPNCADAVTESGFQFLKFPVLQYLLEILYLLIFDLKLQ
jgi:aromatic ring hydroxylase